VAGYFFIPCNIVEKQLRKAAGKEDILKVGERGIHFTQTYA